VSLTSRASTDVRVAALPPDPSTVRLPGPWSHRDVSANGIRLHIAECGSGPLVLLLHGFPEFWGAWRQQLTALADAGYRAVAVDLRGYGDSDKPPRGYDGWTLAGDVAGLIKALGQTRADLVGHAWGGMIAWTVAALHPRLVRSVAAVAAPYPLALRTAARRSVFRRTDSQARAIAQVLRAQLQKSFSQSIRGFESRLWPIRSRLNASNKTSLPRPVLRLVTSLMPLRRCVASTVM